MSTRSLRLLGRRILVEKEYITARRGILLSYKAPPSATARVVAVGVEMQIEWPGLQVGQRVAVRPYSGEILEFDGRTLHLFQKEFLKDVLAVIPEQGGEVESET